MKITGFTIIWILVVLSYLALGANKTKEEAFAEFTRLQEERMRQGKEPLTLLDLINMYSDDDQKEILRETVKDNRIYFEIKGRWDLIDDPSTALGWALHEKEPFNKKVLDVLQSTFSLSEDRSERLQIAVLLYRYDNNTGRNYLLNELLERHDAEVAIVLASNRDQEALAGIREVFESSIPSSELIYVLGRWGSEASPLLSEGLLASRGSPVDYVRALTMAAHRVDSATMERIRRMYEDGRGVTKVGAAAALIRLDPSSREPLEYLLNVLEKEGTHFESEKLFAAWGLSQVGSPEAEEPFRRIVESYASNKEPVYVMPIHVEAARVLAQMEAEEGKLLVVKMLRKMVKEGITDERDIYAIAQAIHDSGLPNSDEILNELMGDEFVAKVQRVRELRALPTRLLPVSSRAFVGTSYWVE